MDTLAYLYMYLYEKLYFSGLGRESEWLCIGVVLKAVSMGKRAKIFSQILTVVPWQGMLY